MSENDANTMVRHIGRLAPIEPQSERHIWIERLQGETKHTQKTQKHTPTNQVNAI